MALSGDDITAITKIVTQANESQFERLSEKLDLTVEPVKETLTSHIAHDESTDKNMYSSLESLKLGQQSLKTKMNVASFIGGSACVGLMGLFLGVVKDLI